jgi:hypothetical protein
MIYDALIAPFVEFEFMRAWHWRSARDLWAFSSYCGA